MIKKYKYYIGGFIALAVIAGIVIYKKAKKMDIIKDFKLGNTITKLGDLIFSVPLNKFDEYPVVIVFGGISYANPAWIMKEVEKEKELLSKAIFVFAPYTMSYDTVSSKLNDFIAKNKLLIKNTSVIGFSAGGLNVQKAYNKNFKFIGLIDPSTRAENVKKDYGDNVKMVYNDANWGGYPQIKSVLPNLADAINKLGGNAEKVNLQHSKIPSYFFNKYKDDIA